MQHKEALGCPLARTPRNLVDLRSGECFARRHLSRVKASGRDYYSS